MNTRNRLASYLLTVVVACAAVFGLDRPAVGSSVYTTSVGTDLVNGSVTQITGASPIAITPANLQYTAATVTPTLSQATPSSDVATNDIVIQSQAPYASAGTNLTAGNIRLNVPAPVSGNQGTRVHVQQGGVDRMQFGGSDVLGATSMALWGPASPTTTNYLLFENSTDSIATLNVNTGGTLNLDVGAAGIAAVTSTGVAVTGLLSASTTLAVTGSSSLQGALIHTSPQTIACSTGGTQTVASSPTSGLIVTSGTLSSNCTIDFSTNASTGDFVLDMSGVTLGASFGVIFKNGSTSSATFLSGSVITTGDTMARVWTHGANTLAVTY